MSDRIGAYRQIIPVTSKPNVPPDLPEAPSQEPGLTWSKQSTFKYSTLTIDPPPPGGAIGAVVKHPAKIEYVTRVERFPAAVKWKTEEYLVFNTGDDYPPPHAPHEEGYFTMETWTEAWYSLGTEVQREIVGYTSFGGSLQERYKSREVEYFLHLRFKKNSIPRRQGIFHTYGELPPL